MGEYCYNCGHARESHNVGGGSCRQRIKSEFKVFKVGWVQVEDWCNCIRFRDKKEYIKDNEWW